MVGLAPVNRNLGEHEILEIGAEAPEFPGLLRLIRRRHLGGLRRRLFYVLYGRLSIAHALAVCPSQAYSMMIAISLTGSRCSHVT